MTVSFNHHYDGDKIEIIDDIENRSILLEGEHTTSLSSESYHSIPFPVDTAVSFETRKITFRDVDRIYLRDLEGELVEAPDHAEAVTVPSGEYTLEVNADIRIYLQISTDKPFEILSSPERVRIVFKDIIEVILGARSLHRLPETTITTTTDPHDLMTALSYLGSALKETSPERSFPTLRGHPPEIEVDNELDIPDSLSIPTQDIWIEVPAETAKIFVAAPLAYYLGCEIRQGSSPRLVTGSGYSHTLDHPTRGYEGEVERVLKQVFFLDCLTRSEGIYEILLYEQKQLRNDLDLDFDYLYDQPISHQIEEYLKYPYETIEQQVPRWGIDAYLSGDPCEVESLPYVIDELAIVRTAEAQQSDYSAADLAGIDDFIRNSSTDDNESSRLTTVETSKKGSLDSARNQVWHGPGVPVRLNKCTVTAYQNRLHQETKDSSVKVTIVQNDLEMNENADLIADLYKSELLELDLNIISGATTDEFERILEEESGLLHFIGHLDEKGFQCPDGAYDASNLEETAIDMFFLNACTAYKQGLNLIDAGAIGGIVTLDNVINSTSIEIGKDIVKNLVRGFSLSASLAIAQAGSQYTHQYVVLGCSAQMETRAGPPTLAEIRRTETGFCADLHTYPTHKMGLGSIIHSYITGMDDPHLVSNTIQDVELSRDELQSYLSSSRQPVLMQGELWFGNELKLPDEDAQYDESRTPENQSIEAELINVHLYSDSYKESLCRRLSELYSDTSLNDISYTELITITQAAYISESLDMDYLTDTAHSLRSEFVDTYQNHPLASSIPEQEVEKIRPWDAREMLRERRAQFKEISRKVFGEVDDRIIDELQWTYLYLIWDSIDFQLDAESDIEPINNPATTPIDTYSL